MIYVCENVLLVIPQTFYWKSDGERMQEGHLLQASLHRNAKVTEKVIVI